MNTYIIVFIVISISAISIYKYYGSRNWTEIFKSRSWPDVNGGSAKNKSSMQITRLED